MKTILVPLDFSDASEHVAKVAMEFARALDGAVVLLHVVWVPPMIMGSEGEADKMKEFAMDVERTANARLREFLPIFERMSVTASAQCVTGRPATVIAEQARELGADYIIIGSHGHTAFYDLVLGSTTSGVIKRAACPVVVVPLKGGKPAKRSRRIATSGRTS